ncbi:MAG: peptidoglycan-binding domain-containing protein [Bryobacteraceae bacterium]
MTAWIAAICLATAGLSLGAAAKKRTASRKPAASSSSKKKPVATSSKKKTASSSKKSSSKRSRSKKGGKRSQTWRNRQTAPTAERYMQIQQALKEKGYLEGEPTGKWDAASQDAMRRFQQEQKIEPTGKINALSLIALGLGPKYDSAAALPPPRPVVQQP